MTQTNTNTVTSSSINESLATETAERVSRIEREFTDGFNLINNHENTVTIFGSARFKEGNKHYEAARAVGAALASEGYTVVTGGGGGIMEAGNRGAFEADGKAIGLNITLPHEQVLNPYTTDSMPFHYFFTRKVVLAFNAQAYVYFPGGFGTLDELFEVITLIQTHKLSRVPVVLVGTEFWSGLDEYIRAHLLDGDQTISPGDEQLYTITDDVDEVIAAIKAGHREPQADAHVGDLQFTHPSQQ